MYQVTFMHCGNQFAVNTPSQQAAEALRNSLPRCSRARLWRTVTKGRPMLVH